MIIFHEFEKFNNLSNYAFLKQQKKELIKYIVENYKIHISKKNVKSIKEKLKIKDVKLRKLPLFVK